MENKILYKIINSSSGKEFYTLGTSRLNAVKTFCGRNLTIMSENPMTGIYILDDGHWIFTVFVVEVDNYIS